MSDTAAPTNPYLQGNFAPVATETTATDLPVTGSLPDALDGLLLRDGPNPAGTPAANHHWFLGDGMIHGVRLRGGRAEWYRNRWVRTEQLGAATSMAAAPTSAVRTTISGTGGVNVVGHAGRILALGEVGLPWRLDAELATVGEEDFAAALGTSVTAHPKFDPVTGEMVFFGYDFGPVNLRYHVADRSGALVHSVEIDTPRPTMMHDFGVTATRVVFMDLPVVFDLEVILAGRQMPFRWDADAGARLGVMPRRGHSDDVVWIEIDPCYVFHPFNAYDDGDRVVMDVIRYPKMFATDLLGPNEPNLGSVWRWVIDPTAGRVEAAALDDRGQEFPRVAPGSETRPYRYGYSVSSRAASGLFEFNEVRKRDFRDGSESAYHPGAGRHPGEAVFVADPDASAEDDGWLLSVIYDAATDRSDVVVLDARDLEAGPVATVALPVRVPYGFHGNWLAATTVDGCP